MAVRKTPAPSNTQPPFPGPDVLEAINAEVQALWQYAQLPLSQVAGGANAITATCDVPLDQNRKGQKFSLVPVAGNTGAATLNINGRGAVSILNRDGSVINSGRLVAGRMEVLENDGTSLRLLQDKPPSASGNYRAIFAYQLPSGTAGQTAPAGWSRYPLNTQVLNTIPGLDFNGQSQQLTLPSGTYEADIEVFAGSSSLAVYLWNVTDNQPLPGMVGASHYYHGMSRAVGQFTLASSKTIEVRVVCAGVVLGYAVGASNPSQPEQYGFLDIRSIA